MIIQIYEVQTRNEASDLCALGVDHIGVLVGDGAFPREIPINYARTIFRGVVSPSKKVALSLSPDLSAIERIVRGIRPDILHLGSMLADVGVAEIRDLKRYFPGLSIMRSIPIGGQESIDAAEDFATVCDFLLLDTHQPKEQQIGATGRVHDWNVSYKIVKRVNIPVILAGGLGPENVRAAILAVNPAGVDSKTRTDCTGKHTKDLEKVARFVQSAKTAN